MARRKTDIADSVAEQFQSLRGDYNAAKQSVYRRRRTGTIATGTGADWHYRVEADFLRLMEQARDMDRNDAIVGQTVDRAVGNTIQEGIRLDAYTGDEKLDQDLEARWEEWAYDPDQCDVMGELTFCDMEHLALRQMFVDGDIFALPLRDGCLQFMESHRCRTPGNTKQNVVHGILLDENRRRLQYWFTKDNIPPYQALNLVSDAEQVDARDQDGYRQVFHVYSPKRVTQTRGVTAFAPIFDLLAMFEDINFAKLVQQQVVSCFAVIREMAIPFDNQVPTGRGEATQFAQGDGTIRTAQGIAPGMEIQGRPGEKLTGFSPAVPNPGFFEHVRLTLTLIGINLGLPLVMTTMDASETNFSGYRGALDQARIGFRRNQKNLTTKFHRHVYCWKVRQWLAEDPILARSAMRRKINIFGHKWNPPTWPYIEPMKDAQADAFRLEKRLVSPYRLFNERGMDADEVVEDILKFNANSIRSAMQVAEQIEEESGIAVDWHEVLTISPLNPMTLTPASDEPDPQGQEPGKPVPPAADDDEEGADDGTD